MISEDTKADAKADDPAFIPETGFSLIPESNSPGADNPPTRGRGRPSNASKGKPTVKPSTAAPGKAPAKVTVIPADPPKALINGSRWIFRNAVKITEDLYGWDKPGDGSTKDFEEWLGEISKYSAVVIHKYVPQFLESYMDELLLLAMILLWVVPNASKKPRKREEPNNGSGGTEGQRKDNAPLPNPVQQGAT